MARKGGGRRTYVRDANGRFASTPGGGGGSKRPKTRMAEKGPNRLTRDNAGKITGQGGNGATVRGGRLKTAKGNRRATQLASMKAAGFRGSTIAKGGRGIRGTVARSLAAARKERTGALGLSRARPGQVGRALARAQANDKRLLQPAMRGTEVRTKAGVGLAVARGAQDYYTGKMPRRKATFSPLTSSRDKKALAARRKRVVDNTKAAKPAKPVNNKPKRSLAVRVAKADKVDRKLAAQLKQAKASGNLKKENELIRRRQRIDRFNKTYNFADLKASRKALTPAKPTAPKRTRASRPAGTVAKPRGMKPGALAARRGAKAKPVRLPKSAAQAVTQANRLLDKLKMQKMKNPGGAGSYQIRDRIDQVNQAIKKIVPGYRHNPTRKGGAAKAAFAEQNRRYGRDARAWNNIGRMYG